jgi:NitT/TauT family transport system ATP-binding protein
MSVAELSEAHDTRIGVNISDVSKVYETRADPILALRDCSLEMKPGEFVSVVGPSGCGKSTLMLMVAGLIPYSAGSIRIGETTVTKPFTDVGIVFQEPVLLDWRKVLENVLLQVEMRKGLDKRSYRRRAEELLDLVGLSGYEDRYPYELSGGMRQRVAICRALVHDPPLLLMDEPFGALDALTRDQLNLDLQTIWMQTRHTVMFVTHSISEAVFLGDRVAVFSDRPGSVVRQLEIDLPRPRHLSIRETPEFGRYAKEIRDVFSSLGVLRDEGSAPGPPLVGGHD